CRHTLRATTVNDFATAPAPVPKAKRGADALVSPSLHHLDAAAGPMRTLSSHIQKTFILNTSSGAQILADHELTNLSIASTAVYLGGGRGGRPGVLGGNGPGTGVTGWSSTVSGELEYVPSQPGG